jgi:hypothetical protein
MSVTAGFFGRVMRERSMIGSRAAGLDAGTSGGRAVSSGASAGCSEAGGGWGLVGVSSLSRLIAAFTTAGPCFHTSSPIVARAISSASIGGWPASPASRASYQPVQTSQSSPAARRAAASSRQAVAAQSGAAPFGQSGRAASSAAEPPESMNAAARPAAAAAAARSSLPWAGYLPAAHGNAVARKTGRMRAESTSARFLRVGPSSGARSGRTRKAARAAKATATCRRRSEGAIASSQRRTSSRFEKSAIAARPGPRRFPSACQPRRREASARFGGGRRYGAALRGGAAAPYDGGKIADAFSRSGRCAMSLPHGWRT